jgi:hypothetical protein
MKKSRNYQWLRVFLAAAVLGAFNAHHALAQTSAPVAPATAIGAPSELDEIVVTGTNIKQTIMQTSCRPSITDFSKNSKRAGI